MDTEKTISMFREAFGTKRSVIRVCLLVYSILVSLVWATISLINVTVEDIPFGVLIGWTTLITGKAYNRFVEQRESGCRLSGDSK